MAYFTVSFEASLKHLQGNVARQTEKIEHQAHCDGSATPSYPARANVASKPPRSLSSQSAGTCVDSRLLGPEPGKENLCVGTAVLDIFAGDGAENFNQAALRKGPAPGKKKPSCGSGPKRLCAYQVYNTNEQIKPQRNTWARGLS